MSTDRPDAEVPPEARWASSGPDPDAPPWAGRDRGEGEAAEDASAEDHAAEDVEDAGDDSDDEPPHAGHAAGGPGAALAEITGGGPQIPRPPKRTGVFVDAEDLREHVGALLRSFLGGYQVDAWGNYTFVHEEARIFVTVGMSPIGPQVGVFSVTNLDIELTLPLAGFLLEVNHQLGFGSFSYDSDNSAIWLRHTLLGTMLDGPELQSAVAAVASSAAHFDDIIRDRFGGRAFHEAPQDVQDATKPPEPSQEAHPNASGYL